MTEKKVHRFLIIQECPENRGVSRHIVITTNKNPSRKELRPCCHRHLKKREPVAGFSCQRLTQARVEKLLGLAPLATSPNPSEVGQITQ